MNMMSITTVCLFLVLNLNLVISDNLNETELENQLFVEHSKVLTRRKRFLLFPDGSSFQLVFCVQTSALVTIGDIFLYGNTAALAWPLPVDPKFLYMYKDYFKNTQRRKDDPTSKEVDDTGKQLAKIPYKRKHILNPVIAKRSIKENHAMSFKEKLKLKLNKTIMHEYQSRREYLKHHQFGRDSISFHRNSRIDLYQKLESLFSSMGQDGRQCVLYKLCKTAQTDKKQGSFLEEFFQVVFTLPKETISQSGYEDYDIAHTDGRDCEKLYTGCDAININI